MRARSPERCTVGAISSAKKYWSAKNVVPCRIMSAHETATEAGTSSGVRCASWVRSTARNPSIVSSECPSATPRMSDIGV